MSRGRSRSRSRGAPQHLIAVSEDELRDAIRVLCLEQGLVVEGAGAAATAAVLAGRVVDRRPGARIIAVLSGRNITVETLLDVLADRSCR